MLICPQCEFENPQANKFCQNCGVSLTNTCCEPKSVRIQSIQQGQLQTREESRLRSLDPCQPDLEANDKHIVLQAIISHPKPTIKYQSEFDNVPIRVANSNSQLKTDICELFTDCQSATSFALQLQTDRVNQRYTIEVDENSKPLLTEINSYFFHGKVIDRYPSQKSHLATLQEQHQDMFAELDSNRYELSASQCWNLIGLPTHALPYLILEKYTPTIPKIYDAWQQEDRGVVLLPDRSQWKLLTELWSQPELPPLQIIWFLDEMAKLWQLLEQVGCTQSLLVDENLRIDEDEAFSLQQLYVNSEVPPTLKDLARTWQLCFTKSGLNNLECLDRLLDRIISEEITKVERLRLELHEIRSVSETGYSPKPSLINLPQSCRPSHLTLHWQDSVAFPLRQNGGKASVGENSIDRYSAKFSKINSNLNMNTSSERNNQLPGSNIEFEDSFFDDGREMTYTSEFEELDTAIIQTQLKSITDASCTDIGVQRNHNEDFFGVRTLIEKSENNGEHDLSARGLYIVCDGMGGHAAGEVASAMAVAELQQYFQNNWRSQLPDCSTIEEGILLANKALYQTNLDNSRLGNGRMGTTLVMALLQDTQCAIAHVGDSRIYRITRQHGLEQLTLDHEVGQREINRGVEPEIAYGRPDAYQLTQALGPRDNDCIRPEIQSLEITEDCLLLLCSDGLSDNNLIEQNWSRYLQPLISSSANLQDGLFKFINLANEHNGHDNITAVLIRIKLKSNF